MDIWFEFQKFVPDDALRVSANRYLDQIVDVAPYGSTVLALMEAERAHYRCSVEIYSVQGSFTATSTHALPTVALSQAHRQMLDKLTDWREQRFGQVVIAKKKVTQMSRAGAGSGDWRALH